MNVRSKLLAVALAALFAGSCYPSALAADPPSDTPPQSSNPTASNAFVFELAELSARAYDVKDGVFPTLGNWRKVWATRSDDLACRATLLADDSRKIATLVFRGTESVQDLGLDGTMLAGGASRGMIGALRITEDLLARMPASLPKYSLVLTGHSKGGIEASFAAAKSGQNAIVFSSPGVPDLGQSRADATRRATPDTVDVGTWTANYIAWKPFRENAPTMPTVAPSGPGTLVAIPKHQFERYFQMTTGDWSSLDQHVVAINTIGDPVAAANFYGATVGSFRTPAMTIRLPQADKAVWDQVNQNGSQTIKGTLDVHLQLRKQIGALVTQPPSPEQQSWIDALVSRVTGGKRWIDALPQTSQDSPSTPIYDAAHDRVTANAEAMASGYAKAMNEVNILNELQGVWTCTDTPPGSVLLKFSGVDFMRYEDMTWIGEIDLRQLRAKDPALAGKISLLNGNRIQMNATSGTTLRMLAQLGNITGGTSDLEAFERAKTANSGEVEVEIDGGTMTLTALIKQAGATEFGSSLDAKRGPSSHWNKVDNGATVSPSSTNPKNAEAKATPEARPASLLGSWASDDATVHLEIFADSRCQFRLTGQPAQSGTFSYDSRTGKLNLFLYVDEYRSARVDVDGRIVLKNYAGPSVTLSRESVR